VPESVATHTTTFSTRVHSFASGLYEEAELVNDCGFVTFLEHFSARSAGDKVEAWGVAGGVMIGWEGVGLSLSCYTAKPSVATLILDEDALDWAGEERE